MTLKQVIKQIFDANIDYLHAQQALNQAQSLKALSDDLYTDSIRFIYELIQNGDDAYDKYNTKNPLIRIAIIDPNYLIVCNYGKPFDENDIRGICCVGCGTKKHDREKTGYKGLGFKAVFGKSHYVLIASKGNFFRFEEKAKEFQWNQKWGKDQTTWETLNRQKFEYPWQICPFWTEANQLPKSIQEWLFAQPEAVATIIRLKNDIQIKETKEAVKDLIQHPHVFMFLKYIKDVRISINSKIETVLKISSLKDGSIKISSDNNKIISHWLLHSCKLNVPDIVHNDVHLPEKLHKEKIVEMTLAAQIDSNDKIISVRGSDSVLFAYLPTKISTYNLPILVNTNFLVNASREHIHIDSTWNQWLFSCIPNETFKWIQKLTKDPKWNDKAYDLLPNENPTKDTLAQKYNQSCLNSVNQIPFILSIDKKSLSINEAVVDITLFSCVDCIGHELIRDFIMHTSSSKLKLAQNPFVTNNHRLRNLRITQFTWEKCLEMLQSRYFLSKFTPEGDMKFINYLFMNYNSTQIKKRLYELPFIMDQSGCLRRVIDIHFPSRFSSADWHMIDNTVAYVHHKIMTWLNTHPQIKEWLRKLGINEKTDMTFVEQYIIPHIRTYIIHANAVITITRLFNLFHHGLLSTQHFHDLRHLKLLTVGGTLVSACQLYFSANYLPQLPLDYLDLDNTLFVCPSYLQTIEGIGVHQWKYFFQCLGVRENICLTTIDDDKCHNELVSAYISAHTLNLPSYAVVYGFKNRMTILYIELTQINYQFAIIFWEYVIRSINVNHLNEPETLFTQRRIIIKNLPKWCIQTRFCIPTTTGQLLPSTQVYSNDLKTIAGKYLPVFVCNVRTPMPNGWQHFFEFKTELSIEDCYLLLDHIYHHSLNILLDDDEERRIQHIYTILINRLSQMDVKHRNQHKINRPLHLLSTQENQFLSSNEIVYSIDNNLILPFQIAQLRLNLENSRNLHLDLLLEIFNIRTIRMSDLSLSNNVTRQFSRTLHTKLRNIQPYLFALADFQKIVNHSIDYDLEIFEVDQLELCFDKNIPVSNVSIHLSNNQLYIKRPWNSNETMEILPGILCEQFKLPLDIEPDLKLMLMAESTSIIDEYFIQRNIPIQTYLIDDLLNTGGTREKFSAMIDRDNAKLFSNLKITDTMNAAEILLAGLKAQDSKWTDYIYHFTHIENAVNILSDGILKARDQLSDNYFKDSAAENVIKTTRNIVKTYARFYFRPLTPTQRCNENLGSSDLIERYGNKPVSSTYFFSF